MGQPQPLRLRLGELRPAALGVPREGAAAGHARQHSRGHRAGDHPGRDLGREPAQPHARPHGQPGDVVPVPALVPLRAAAGDGPVLVLGQRLARREGGAAVGVRPEQALRPGGRPGGAADADAVPDLRRRRALRVPRRRAARTTTPTRRCSTRPSRTATTSRARRASRCTPTRRWTTSTSSRGSSAAARATRRCRRSTSSPRSTTRGRSRSRPASRRTASGVPWGYLGSVNDVFKSPQSDRDQSMAFAHPQVSGGAFTYTSIHEASHYLGLAHPHDSIGATRNADGSPRYYDGFTWAFNSTAAPTTYSHTELVYSILDQENIARGHAAYYLKWTDEALSDGGERVRLARRAPRSRCCRRTPRGFARRRSTAQKQAEAMFARFDFVNATFAAQKAWRSAAAYRDLALGLAPGTSELRRARRRRARRPARRRNALGTTRERRPRGRRSRFTSQEDSMKIANPVARPRRRGRRSDRRREGLTGDPLDPVRNVALPCEARLDSGPRAARGEEHRARRERLRLRRHRHRVPVPPRRRRRPSTTTRSSGRWAAARASSTSPTRRIRSPPAATPTPATRTTSRSAATCSCSASTRLASRGATSTCLRQKGADNADRPARASTSSGWSSTRGSATFQTELADCYLSSLTRQARTRRRSTRAASTSP